MGQPRENERLQWDFTLTRVPVANRLVYLGQYELVEEIVADEWR